MKKYLLSALAILLTATCGQAATLLPAARHIFISVANDAGVRYNYDGATYGGPDGSYFIKADGGGLGSNHVTTDPSNTLGQTTVQTTADGSASGIFYVNDTGGRSFTDNTILMISVAGPVHDNFSVTIRASGYRWVPNPVANLKPTAYDYITYSINETFTKTDLIYGPHNYKPGPNSGGAYASWVLPLYYGQDTTTVSHYLMFVDLGVGMLKGASPTDFFWGVTDGGAVKVEFGFSHLFSEAAINIYGWCLNANQAQGINWTNTTNSETTSNGYVLRYTGGPVGDPFVDVPPGHWAEAYVKAIYDAGITAGYGGTDQFKPDFEVTREQMAAFLVRAREGEPAAGYCDGGSAFTDVDPSSWSCKYIKRLQELGITAGYGGTDQYKPGMTVTREQMAAFLVRAREGEPAAGYCDGGSAFTDVDPSSWSCKYIKRLQELGITAGYGGTDQYKPGMTVTRAQMAAFIARAFLGYE